MAKLIPLCIMITMVALPFSATSSIADLRGGDEFITTMDGNTMSGIGADGLAFNLYFLAGGRVTYSSLGRVNVSGTWKINRDGDVCINWSERVDALEGCFEVSFDGDTVIWRNKSGSRHGTLRGSVVGSGAKPQL